MKNQEKRFSCHSCGKEVECSTEQPPCEVLRGWITIAYWGGLQKVSHYNFCSFTCLKSWVDAQVPKIPGVFLKSFEEED